MRDAGAWSVYAGTMPEHADRSRPNSSIPSSTALIADGITDDELEIAKGYLAGSYEMGLEDSGARMSRLGGQLTLLGEVRSVESQIDRWSAVTLDDVDRVVGRVYGAGQPVTVSLGPS